MTLTAARARTGPSGAATSRPDLTGNASFRPDVQGLRAIAVSMVVIYHLFPNAVPGGFVGVDVFFVISGFLITGHLARTFDRHGRVKLLEFWGRRARRLLPAAAVVLTVTWIVSRLVLPATRLPATAEQIRGSALYYQNWILARDAVDYLTSADAPSPVQHFWSLSVEEQFYLFWPFLFVIAAVIGMRAHRRLGRIAALSGAGLITVASLVWSSHLTGTDPAAAYFVTTTRVWELGVGGVLAMLSAPLGRIVGRLGILGWLGLATVVTSAFVITSHSPFPGTIALLPVLGSALLLAAGSRASLNSPWRLTSARPMVFLGDISYSLYLWHWPMIVLYKDWAGHGVGRLSVPAIIIGAVLLSWLTKIFVEDKVRQSPKIAGHTGRSLATALAVVVPVGLAAMYTPPSAPHAPIDAKHPGGRVLATATARVRLPAGAVPRPGTAVSSLKTIPSVDQAPLDFQPFNACETPIPGVTPRPCFYGNTKNPRVTIALVGDSVAGQYTPVLTDLVKKRGWLLVTDFHGGCPWTATLLSNYHQSNRYTQCRDWGRIVQHDMITKYHPQVLFTSDRPVLGTPTHPHADRVSFGQTAAGMVNYWKQLGAHGIKVVAIRESPEPGRNVPDCLSKQGATVGSCTASAAKAIVKDTPLQQAVARMNGAVELVDPAPLTCTPTICPPIVGNVIVYRDVHHLTFTYVRSIEPYLEKLFLGTKAMRGL